MKVTIKSTRENFLLSDSDLKNLELLSLKFPNYIGILHIDDKDSMKADGNIVNQTDINQVILDDKSSNNMTGTIPMGVGNVADSQTEAILLEG